MFSDEEERDTEEGHPASKKRRTEVSASSNQAALPHSGAVDSLRETEKKASLEKEEVKRHM